MSQHAPAVAFCEVSITYAGAHEPVLRSVTLDIEEGELVLLVGRTGAGKSTLLGAINGTVPHFTGGTLAGRVLVYGRDTRTHRPTSSGWSVRTRWRASSPTPSRRSWRTAWSSWRCLRR